MFHHRNPMAPSVILKLAATALLASYTEAASYNGLALTPQMGWVCTTIRIIDFYSWSIRIIGMPSAAMSVKNFC